MAKLSIHQAAERDAIQAAACIYNDKTARLERTAAYGRAVARYAQEIDAGERCAWASLASDEVPADDASPLIVELRDWLKNGRRVEQRQRSVENSFTRRTDIQQWAVATNETWIRRLFIADDKDARPVQFGNSGTAFDQMDLFTFDEAARALVFNKTGQICPSLATALTPLGREFHDWRKVLYDSANESGAGALQACMLADDKKKTPLIRRQDFAAWCDARGMHPAFLFPSSPIAASATAMDGETSAASAEEPPDAWARGLKRAAWEVARQLVAESGTLTGAALWGGISIREDVTVSGEVATYKRSVSGYGKPGEETAKAKTIKGAWRQTLEKLLMQKP